MRPKRVVALAIVGGLLALAVWGLGIQVPPGPRSAREFDADRVADLEAAMWQSYYRQENAALFGDLVMTLREQFRYPWAKAALAGYHLAHAAATFGKATSDYEQVLPDLQKAYGISREWTGSGYDPSEVARAELAWWVARRDPNQRDPENVGRLIGVLYARFYEVPEAKVHEAGVLRARAAALRDKGGVTTDWTEVSRLLHESYRSLRAGLHS